MRRRIGIENNSGVQQVLRVGEGLELSHESISLASPFRFDKRSHIPASAMFGFQCAVVLADHQMHNVTD